MANLRKKAAEQDAAALKAAQDAAGKTLTGKELVKWKYQHYMRDYLACVQGVDDSVGRVMALLDDQLDPHDVLLQTSVDHLSVIPADRNLTGAEIELVTRPQRELRLRRIVEPRHDRVDGREVLEQGDELVGCASLQPLLDRRDRRRRLDRHVGRQRDIDGRGRECSGQSGDQRDD